MRMQPTGYVAGTWLAVCDRCGFAHRNTELRLEWTGLRVCRECWEPRNVQDQIRGVADRQAPAWVRPEPPDIEVGTVLPEDL